MKIQQKTIRLTFSQPTNGYWDGGVKTGGDFKFDPHKGIWECQSLNYYFTCCYRAKVAAKMLRKHCRDKAAKVEIIEEGKVIFTYLLVGKPRKFYRNLWNAEDHGSDRLFLACWSELLGWRWVETYDTYNEVLKKLDEIASFKVNNSRSSFYIYGR